MKISIVPLLALSLTLSGCAYYSHPAKIGQTSAFNGTTAAFGLAGAAGGAALGNALDKDIGAPIGAAAGAVLAGGASYVVQQRHQRQLAEAHAQGLRQGRAQVYDEWWSENAILNDPSEKAGKKGPKTRQVQLPEGFYESVPYHRRSYKYLVTP